MRNSRRQKGPVNTGSRPDAGDPALTFYIEALRLLEATAVPFVVGGAFAHSRYTGRERETKDLDIMLRQEDVPCALAAFENAGYQVDVPFPHWLGKVHRGGRTSTWCSAPATASCAWTICGSCTLHPQKCSGCRSFCARSRSCSGPAHSSRSASATTAQRSCTCYTRRRCSSTGPGCSSDSATIGRYSSAIWSLPICVP